VVSCQSTTHW